MRCAHFVGASVTLKELLVTALTDTAAAGDVACRYSLLSPEGC